MDSIKKYFLRRSKSSGSKDAMKALVYVKDGSMKMSSNTTIPSLSSTQVLVKVHYASLNHLDYKRTQLPLGFKQDEPVGLECVGEIVKLGWIAGDEVHKFSYALGDVVFGLAYGCLAEYVVMEASNICIKPDSVDDEQAASLSLSSLTAFQALKKNNLSDGMNILVIGASGSTGQSFVKIAKLMAECTVIGVSSSSHLKLLEGIGCDGTIDYDNQKLQDVISPQELDLVIDCVSNPNVPESVHYEETVRQYELLKQTGKYLSLNAKPFDTVRSLLSRAIKVNVQRKGFDAVIVQPEAADELKELAAWYSEGRITIGIDEIVKFEEKALVSAFEKLKGMHCSGKLLVRVYSKKR